MFFCFSINWKLILFPRGFFYIFVLILISFSSLEVPFCNVLSKKKNNDKMKFSPLLVHAWFCVFSITGNVFSNIKKRFEKIQIPCAFGLQ